MVHHYCFVHLKISRGRKCCNGPLQELAGSRSKLQPQTPQHSREVGAKSSENGQTSLPSQRKGEKEKGEIITQWEDYLRKGVVVQDGRGIGTWEPLFGKSQKLILQNYPECKPCYLSGEFIWIDAISLQGKPKGLLFNGKSLQKFSIYKLL